MYIARCIGRSWTSMSGTGYHEDYHHPDIIAETWGEITRKIDETPEGVVFTVEENEDEDNS